MASYFKRFMLLMLATGAPGFSAIAQDAAKQNLPTDQAVPSLMFFTLGAFLLVAIVTFVMFLRNRSNREATKRGLDIKS